MTLFHRIRSSFTTQLTLWVAGFVIVIYGVVIFLLVRFSQQVVIDETIETTMQALENTALRIDNTLRQAEMTAFLEHRTFAVDQKLVERLIKENRYFESFIQSLSHAQLVVSADNDGPLSSYIVEAEGGYQRIVYENEDCFVFHEPFYNQRFRLVVICPAQDVFAPFNPVKMFLLVTGLAGLLLILFFCWKVIARHLWPLHLLADSAQLIADGHLAVQVPDSGMKNEIGQLQNSFATMQLALASFMDEMHQKQVEFAHQNTELEQAYQQAQEYDKLKNRFLSNMTDQMIKPIDAVCKCTDQICTRYPSMSKTEMEQIEKSILTETESVTKLLEQLLNVTDATL